MNLLALRYFYETARAGTVTEAAKKMRVSQPGVTKMIRQLEEELRTPLLVRSRSGVSLTAAGERVLLRAERIFAEERSLLQSVQDPLAPLEGDLCVGLSDTLAIHLFPAVITRFKADNPAVRLQLFCGTAPEIKAELLADRCDLGLFFTPLRAGEPFQSGVVSTTEFWIVAARSLQKRYSRPFTVSSLKKLRVPRIESRQSDYSDSGPVAHFHGTRLGFTDPAWIQVNHHEVKKALILEGAGFGVMARPTVETEVRAGRLVQVPAPFPLRSEIYWCRKREAFHRAAQHFLDALIPLKLQ